MALKHLLVRSGLAALAGSGLYRALAPMTRGRGVILTLHHVRPWRERAFAPNRTLEITPEFLDLVLRTARSRGFEFVTLEECLYRLAHPRAAPFCALTIDDGFRDTVDFALPVMRAHGAPFTLFVAPGFAERTASLWWVDLEDAIARLDNIEFEGPSGPRRFETVTAQQKSVIFEKVYWLLRRGSEESLRAVIGRWMKRAGLASADSVETLCLDWDGIVRASRDPLVSIGVHTVNHFMLAKQTEAVVRDELVSSRRRIEERIGKAAPDLAYPVGDPSAAGQREFAIARELGYRCALTTRPGVLFDEHLDHLTALPRVSLNGNFQRQADIEVLLSGAPFLLWNRGRRLNVA